MDTLLSVFLYLGVVTSPGTYTTAQINNYEQIYQAGVMAVEDDPVLFEAVIAEFYPRAEIIIIDGTVG